MSEPKFTPGPWVVDSRASLRVMSGSEVTVANTGGDSTLSLEEAQANATLIAVAPEMYDLLSQAVWCRGKLPTAQFNQWFDDALACLKKARGE